jgi:hypothetical protein
MHALRTNAMPYEEDNDIFGDENLQVYARYSFDPKANRGFMEISVVKLKVTLDEGPRSKDQ